MTSVRNLASLLRELYDKFDVPDENGVKQLDVAPDHGYTWVRRNGEYSIEKIGCTLSREWNDPHLRGSIEKAQAKVF